MTDDVLQVHVRNINIQGPSAHLMSQHSGFPAYVQPEFVSSACITLYVAAIRISHQLVCSSVATLTAIVNAYSTYAYFLFFVCLVVCLQFL